MDTPSPSIPPHGFRSSLLDGAQSLINEHADEHEKQHAGARAEDPHGLREPVHFHQQLGLLLLHVGVGVVEIELFILVHGECAAIDEEDDQANGKNNPHRCQPDQ